ncbi:hypothetical protein [Pseudomonas floridensis]|uniref:hypothetical protein n=1 Tax=Pseudomonas floridensis TaxID=1958950 RepID=UPI0012FF9C40|nr:hypothetical protein [Pseudomonas floridensis]
MTSEIYVYMVFVITGIRLYLPSFWARYTFSGKGFTATRFWILNVYNIILGYLHMRFIENNSIPLYGYLDSSMPGWFSMAMIIAHVCTHSVTWEITPWRSKRKGH